MTLLSICVAAADEIGLPQPTAIISNADPQVQKLLRYANRVGWRLMKNVAWQALRGEQTFTSVATETQTSILPTGFDRIVPETFWDRTDMNLIAGPVSPVQWQGLKANNYNDTSRRKWAYRGDAVIILPTMPAGQSLAFEYVSQYWCESNAGAGQTAWAADLDVGVLDEELLTLALKYNYLTDEGLPNGAAAADFDDYFRILVDNDQPDAGVMVAADIFGGGRHFSGAPPVDGNASSI